jgi:Rha family phage regulatory protein
MNELVFRGANDQVMTNSLLVAEKFGKEHRHVLRDIENLSCSNDFRQSNFGLSSYFSQQNKELPMYLISKDGFSFLVMGYTGVQASKFKEDFLSGFNKMESMLKSDDYILARSQEILQNRLQLATQKVQILESTVEKQTEQIQILVPKATYTDEVLQSTTTFTLTQVAHDLNMRSVYVFTTWLAKKGILFYQSRQWQPTAKVSGKHYFATRTAKYIKNGQVCSSLTTVVTELGRAWLHTLLKQEESAA